jgi:predicted RNase H-like HicB family nuclease
MTEHYTIVVFWSDQDDTWIADAPDLKSCSAHGDTPEAAVAELRVAMEGWLEVARERGMPVPPARFRVPADAAE